MGSQNQLEIGGRTVISDIVAPESLHVAADLPLELVAHSDANKAYENLCGTLNHQVYLALSELRTEYGTLEGRMDYEAFDLPKDRQVRTVAIGIAPYDVRIKLEYVPPIVGRWRGKVKRPGHIKSYIQSDGKPRLIGEVTVTPSTSFDEDSCYVDRLTSCCSKTLDSAIAEYLSCFSKHPKNQDTKGTDTAIHYLTKNIALAMSEISGRSDVLPQFARQAEISNAQQKLEAVKANFAERAKQAYDEFDASLIADKAKIQGTTAKLEELSKKGRTLVLQQLARLAVAEGDSLKAQAVLRKSQLDGYANHARADLDYQLNKEVRETNESLRRERVDLEAKLEDLRRQIDAEQAKLQVNKINMGSYLDFHQEFSKVFPENLRTNNYYGDNSVSIATQAEVSRELYDFGGSKKSKLGQQQLIQLLQIMAGQIDDDAFDRSEMSKIVGLTKQLAERYNADAVNDVIKHLKAISPNRKILLDKVEAWMKAVVLR